MSKCWYCNEELTSATYCDEHVGICTKCYGSMFKVSNDFVKVLTDKIADLEAKLAESEETINNLEQQCLICNKDKENEQLKQQLAEKEKLINTYFVSQTNKLMTPPTQQQDKISFAVEKLYNVRCFVEDIDFNYGDDERINRFAVMNEIDDIIEQLTHQHEDKGE